jgi:hypothetical protein
MDGTHILGLPIPSIALGTDELACQGLQYKFLGIKLVLDSLGLLLLNHNAVVPQSLLGGQPHGQRMHGLQQRQHVHLRLHHVPGLDFPPLY